MFSNIHKYIIKSVSDSYNKFLALDFPVLSHATIMLFLLILIIINSVKNLIIRGRPRIQANFYIYLFYLLSFTTAATYVIFLPSRPTHESLRKFIDCYGLSNPS